MAEAIRVGILNDMADAPGAMPNIEHWLRLEVDVLRQAGRLDRDIEFIHAWGLGLPMGTAAKVERSLRALAKQDVLLVVGPAIGDNALAVTPLVEQLGIPTINWAGAERARGEYMFHVQVGSHEDESLVIARHLAALGVRRAGVLSDRSPIGRRHLAYLQSEAGLLGLDIVAQATLAPLAQDATTEVAALLDTGAEAVVYLGLGLSAPAAAKALLARNWTGPRIMNTAGIRGLAPDFARIIDGWMYIDMHADDNAELNAICQHHATPRRERLFAAKGHDIGRLVAEGLARAGELTREGVKQGLEQVKWLPAAQGHEGTLLGFGIQDRGALHGRYLVVRKWRDGESVQQ